MFFLIRVLVDLAYNLSQIVTAVIAFVMTDVTRDARHALTALVTFATTVYLSLWFAYH